MIPKPHIRRSAAMGKWQCYSDAIDPKDQQARKRDKMFTIGFGDTPAEAYEMWMSALVGHGAVDLTEHVIPQKTIWSRFMFRRTT